MEEKELEYLKKWKAELEQENSNYRKQLESLNQERRELRLKKDILTRVVYKYSNSSALEDFKIATGYDTITNELREKDKDYFTAEEEISKKIAYNNAIIEEINLLLS
jgi:hypothetical protein